jgi:putative DNA primase/helicase
MRTARSDSSSCTILTFSIKADQPKSEAPVLWDGKPELVLERLRQNHRPAEMVAMMMFLDAAARALGGDIRNGQVVCPGPGHSLRDRSLAVRFHTGGGYLVHSFAGDDPMECRDHVDRLLGLSGWKPGERHSPKLQARASSSAGMDRFRKIELARSIYEESIPTPGTQVDLYLVGRCLSAPDVLRFHPACLFGKHRHPAMVAPMVDIHTDQFRGIHRTPIDIDGKKTGEKMMLGQAAGAVVKLSPDEEVTTVLGIGEGIETTLSLPRLPECFGIPVWACLSAGAMATFPVLPGIEVLWIAVDNDLSGAGERAAQGCADRWTAAGCEVWLQTPYAVRSDLNDVVKEYCDAR